MPSNDPKGSVSYAGRVTGEGVLPLLCPVCWRPADEFYHNGTVCYARHRLVKNGQEIALDCVISHGSTNGR